MTDSVQARVIRAIAAYAGSPAETLTLELRFVADLGFDSLDNVEALMALEDEFEIELPDDDADAVVTIADAVALCIKYGAA